MEDLFYREQQIFDAASKRLSESGGEACEPGEYEMFVKEYGRLLKQLRRITKLSDKTTVNLNSSKLDLLDKVNFDALTGIYNRRFMEENLRRIVKSAARSGDILSVLMIDIDFFKKYNDTYGHGEGDACLKTVAEVLRKSVERPDDFVARYGGEEFAVILPKTYESGARIIARKILNNIETQCIPHEKNLGIGYVTVSIGITTGDVKHSHSGADYIKRADKALYMSKQSGRNKYTFLNFKGEFR